MPFDPDTAIGGQRDCFPSTRLSLIETAAAGERLAATPEHDWDVFAIEAALRDLERVDPRKTKIVELRFFGGLSIDENGQGCGGVCTNCASRPQDGGDMALQKAQTGANLMRERRLRLRGCSPPAMEILVSPSPVGTT
jgi:hypothetical protein